MAWGEWVEGVLTFSQGLAVAEKVEQNETAKNNMSHFQQSSMSHTPISNHIMCLPL